MGSKNGKGEVASVREIPPIKSEMTSSQHARGRSQNGYDMLPLRDESHDRLAASGAPMGGAYRDQSRSPSPAEDVHHMHRQPQLPDVEYRGIAL